MKIYQHCRHCDWDSPNHVEDHRSPCVECFTWQRGRLSVDVEDGDDND